MMTTTTSEKHTSLGVTLTVIVERMPGNWGAYAPDLEDSVIAVGDTREETISNFRDALLDLLDDKKARGLDVPNIVALEVRETREIGTLEVQAPPLHNSGAALS